MSVPTAIFYSEVPPDLMYLSNDIKNLYEKRILTDFHVYVGGWYKSCHKAILAARSPYLAVLIRKAVARNENSLQIVDVELPMIEAILAYIYTGNICLLTESRLPLLDFYDMTERYGLYNVKDLLTGMLKPDVVAKEETINSFAVTITDFSCISANFDAVQTQTLKIGLDVWCVTVQLVSVDEKESIVGIYLNRATNRPFTHFVEFFAYVVDFERKVCFRRELEHVFRRNSQCGFPTFLSREKLLSLKHIYLPGDTLTVEGGISIKSEIYEPQTTIQLSRKLFELPPSPTLWRAFVKGFVDLSKDMFDLLHTDQLYRDTLLVCNNLEVCVHMCILSTRTCTSYLQLNNLLNTLVHPAIKSFISYLYTGQRRFLREHAISVYSSASKLELHSLKAIYSFLLQTNLTEGNALNVLEEAHYYNDRDLKQSAMFFIKENSNIILRSREWRMFSTQLPKLAGETLAYVYDITFTENY